MTLFADIRTPEALRARAEKSLSLPIGLANPLWLAFGAAATTGAAWWMLTRMVKPANLEAVLAAGTKAVEAPLAKPEAAVAETPVPAPVAAEPVVVEIFTPVAEAVEEAFDPEPVVELLTAAADDLTRLAGVGPRIAAALAEQGVNSFADLAAWTPERLAAFDAERKLMGRSLRDAWLDQAKALAGEV